MNIDVRHIAKLACLKVEEDELVKIQQDMQSLITMVERLPEINDESVIEIKNAMVLRGDEASVCSISKEELLSNAPETESGCFAVPKTVV